MHKYSATTRNIKINVIPSFLEEQSDPDDGYYFWAYSIEIENLGAAAVQLRSRYWRIIDALGQAQEVRGAGVVGEEPVIAPGDSYRYTSGAPLPTPSGMMHGCYQMQHEDGELFNVDIPAFSLDSPHEKNKSN